MAVNMITSGFLLLVLVAGVQSAIKELGEACASTDSCVSPLAVLVCNTPPTKTAGVCRVKAGQPCKAAGGLCVVGAECTVSGSTDTCDCKAGYTLVPATGQCTPPDGGYYDTCATSTSDCTLTGVNNAASACSTDGGCKCATATPVPNYANGQCVALANSMVGQACTSATVTTDCGANTHLSCPTTACVCDAGYFSTKTPGGTCVDNTVVSSIGKGCSTNSDCKAANNEICNSATPKVCACASGFTGQPGGACYPNAGTLKGGCSGTSCSGGLMCTSYQSAPYTCKTAVALNGACSDTTATACATGLTCTAAGMCAKTVVPKGGDCSNTATTECATGLICDTTCKTEVDVGGDCSDAATTKCKARTTCTSNKCVVAANYVGGSCSVTGGPPAFTQGTCQGTDIVCGAVTSGICVCDSGYKADPAKDCAIIAHMYGASCTGTANTKADCGDDSLVCSSSTCGCATAAGYTVGSEGGVCYKPPSANSLGGACTSATSCTDPNAECSGSSVCQCKTDYVVSYFTKQCVLKVDSTTTCTGKTCIEGSTCDATSNKCKCVTGTVVNGGGYCVPTTPGVLGGTCTITTAASTAKGTCTVANTKCEYGTCACEDTYTMTLEGSCSNDAMMITTSSLLITLAAVISQLFVR